MYIPPSPHHFQNGSQEQFSETTRTAQEKISVRTVYHPMDVLRLVDVEHIAVTQYFKCLGPIRQPFNAFPSVMSSS